MVGVVGTSLANNQRTQGTNLDRQLLDLDRVVVTLERESVQWKVSRLDTL